MRYLTISILSGALVALSSAGPLSQFNDLESRSPQQASSEPYSILFNDEDNTNAETPAFNSPVPRDDLLGEIDISPLENRAKNAKNATGTAAPPPKKNATGVAGAAKKNKTAKAAATVNAKDVLEPISLRSWIVSRLASTEVDDADEIGGVDVDVEEEGDVDDEDGVLVNATTPAQNATLKKGGAKKNATATGAAATTGKAAKKNATGAAAKAKKNKTAKATTREVLEPVSLSEFMVPVATSGGDE